MHWNQFLLNQTKSWCIEIHHWSYCLHQTEDNLCVFERLTNVAPRLTCVIVLVVAIGFVCVWQCECKNVFFLFEGLCSIPLCKHLNCEFAGTIEKTCFVFYWPFISERKTRNGWAVAPWVGVWLLMMLKFFDVDYLPIRVSQFRSWWHYRKI